MLLHFDRVVMAKGAYLLYPFVDLGLVPEAGSSLLLARVVGELNAKKVLMDPSAITAEEASRLSLATDLCEEGQALSTCMDVARRMASRPRLAMAATKRLIKGHREALAEHVIREFDAFAHCLGSDDAQARLTSLMDGRS